jgi:Icc protein
MPSVQLLQVTDTHLFGDRSRELYDTNTGRSLDAALQAALGPDAPRPDAILVTGDVAEDSSREAYGHFRRALGALGAPVYCLPGNHDAPALMAELLAGDGFQYCGAADLGAWRLVMLDTHIDRDPCGRLEAGELARLDRELAAAAARPALVALHHPPVAVGSPWIDGVGLRNPADLYAVLERHPNVRAVVGGHVHQVVDQRRGALRVLATPSTCAQFRPHTADCEMDDRPPGFRWLTLHDDGTIDTRVGWAEAWQRRGTPRDTRGPDPARH